MIFGSQSLRLWPLCICRSSYRRAFTTPSRSAKEGDRLILRQVKEESKRPQLTKPLRHGKINNTIWGEIEHTSLIGKQARDTIHTSTGRELRVHFPTLEEYATLTPRLVTPLYPADANFLVSLLDIHISRPARHDKDLPTIEILEAGTGHGSLTLHLARAIHGANPRPPDICVSNDKKGEAEALPGQPPPVTREEISGTSGNSTPEASKKIPAEHHCSEGWKKRRGAIVHTIDVSPVHSQHAKEIVCGFRQGIYAGDIDFHVGDVSDWIDEQQKVRISDALGSTEGAFLSHVILDMPASHRHVDKVASALHVDGSLMLFNPSVTQIMEAVKLIRERKLPLVLDRILELGPTMTGGREWDVRAVKPRAILKAQRAEEDADVDVKYPTATTHGDYQQRKTMDEVPSASSGNEASSQAPKRMEEGWEMVCRPKVGERVVGGGFLGLWRRMKHRKDTLVNE